MNYWYKVAEFIDWEHRYANRYTTLAPDYRAKLME